MKVSILTNFDDYNHNLFCDDLGVITLKLTPKYINNISKKQNYKNKIGTTNYRKRYCTVYKKNKDTFLYKFTNHRVINNTYCKQIINSFEFDMPLSTHSKFISRKTFLINKYRDYKFHKYRKKYISILNKITFDI